MVNPNDPNSEPDGTPPSDPTPDSNSGDSSDTPGSESGLISDELFDSLSDLIGDSPDTDEPASLPDIESWSDRPAEAASPAEANVDEPIEEPTLIRFDTEVEGTPDPDELIPSEPSDTVPIEPPFTTATPGDSLGDIPPSQSSGEDQMPDLGSDETPEADLLPTDDWSTPDLESPLFSADVSEPSEPLSSDAAASDDLTETSPDPWIGQLPEEVSSVDPITEDLEDPTVIQGVPTVIQPVSNTEPLPDATDDLSNVEPPIEDQPQDLWADEPPSDPSRDEDQEAVADIPPETTVPISESTEPTMAVPPPTGESMAESSRDRDPDPIPVATGAGSSPPSSGMRAASNRDLGPLSGKLPLNRYQSVGLLVAMSTLGTITYLGVTGNNEGQSLITPGVITSSPTPEATRATPPSDVAVVPPPPQARTAPPAQPNPEPEAETPDVQPEAISGITPAAAPTPSKLDISDVPADHWAYPFITKLHTQGILADYPDGQFQPDKPATRAEVAAQIQRAFVNESGQRQLTFSDIPANYWAAAAIEEAVDKKFMSGYPEGDFRPDKLVPRYEVLVALVSGLELNPPSSPESSLRRFQDQGQLPDWSKGKIAASTLGGMVVNHPDPLLLEPDRNATRAEVAAMIHQALVQKGKLEPIDSKFVVAPEP